VFSKRLEKGTFEMPKIGSSAKSIYISSQHLQLILEGIHLDSIRKRVRYEHCSVDKTSMTTVV
jgi:hypothetical protein